MPHFRWQGSVAIPAQVDLRLRGWRLIAEADGACGHPAAPGCLILVDGRQRISLPWRIPYGESARLRELRRWVLIFGITGSHERQALLRMGLGDVLGDEFAIDELAARARRVLANATMLPCFRRHGPLRLELLARDGYVDGKRLGLHPREFALAWRLMDEPGQPVDKATLLRDVWRLDHVPETNSLAVHARRLRAKLEIAGLAGFVLTTAGGGYGLRNVRSDEVPASPGGDPALVRITSPLPLAGDRRIRITEANDFGDVPVKAMWQI